MRIEPTVGRVVWFIPGRGDPLNKDRGEQPLAATVCHVREDGKVNLSVHDAYGGMHSRARVVLLQQGETIEAGTQYCCWMPYQLGQAAKTEQVAAAANTPQPTAADGA